MGWARLDDGFHDHPKVDGLSLAAVGLYTLTLTWAHRHRSRAATPGHIAVTRVQKVAGRDAHKLATELLTAGLWEQEQELGGYVIHDFADYLPKERDPNERREAGRKGAASRWQADGKLPSSSMANDSSRASAPASPSRPVPNPTQEPELPSPPDGGGTIELSKSKFTAKYEPDFNRFWAIYPRKVEKVQAHKKWDDACRSGVPPAVMIDAAKRYADEMRGKDMSYVVYPERWLGKERWTDEPGHAAPPTKSRRQQETDDLFERAAARIGVGQ